MKVSRRFSDIRVSQSLGHLIDPLRSGCDTGRGVVEGRAKASDDSGCYERRRGDEFEAAWAREPTARSSPLRQRPNRNLHLGRIRFLRIRRPSQDGRHTEDRNAGARVNAQPSIGFRHPNVFRIRAQTSIAFRIAARIPRASRASSDRGRFVHRRRRDELRFPTMSRTNRERRIARNCRGKRRAQARFLTQS